MEYANIKKKLREKFEERDKYEILEEIDDELRAYVWTYFEKCKHFPTWPDSTPIMFTGNDILGLPPISKYRALNTSNKLYRRMYNDITISD